MVSYDVAWACPLQPAPAMFIDDAHILRASSSTVWACISKRPAIARIECGSVIKRVAMLAVSLLIVTAVFVCHERRWPDPLCAWLRHLRLLSGHVQTHAGNGPSQALNRRTNHRLPAALAISVAKYDAPLMPRVLTNCS